MNRSSNRTGKKPVKKRSSFPTGMAIGAACVILCVAAVVILSDANLFSQKYDRVQADVNQNAGTTTAMAEAPASTTPVVPPLDKAAYNAKMMQLANYPLTTSTTTVRLWPVKAPYPLPGALLPFNRIVAYYGNLYSTQMGVLGEYPPAVMLGMLQAEARKWELADPSTPVIPALDYIAVTAQGSPGADGMYRLRMPDSQIDQIIQMAAQVNGIVFLDLQVGLSNVQTEVPLLKKYLMMPQVHLALDPEFSMKTGAKPGTQIGTMDATDINFAANYLAKLVDEYNLPPKILVVHRFTQDMVTNYQNITPLPEVQIVMDMDGWGSQSKKIGTYNAFIYAEPVQFTGFKLFYKNDVRIASTTLLTPAQLLKLKPQPSYIQYQ
jgi:hypothetical protein